MKSYIFPLIVSAVLILMGLDMGCAGSKGEHNAYTHIQTPDGFMYERDTRTRGEVTAPSNAATPSPISVGDDGVNSATSGVFEKTVGQIAAEQSSTLYIIGALIAAAGAVAFWLGQKGLGIGLAIAGAGVISMPFVGPIIAPWIAMLVVISVIAGIVWFAGTLFGWWRAREVEKNVTVAKAVELAKAGDSDGAIKVASTLPRWRDAGAK